MDQEWRAFVKTGMREALCILGGGPERPYVPYGRSVLSGEAPAGSGHRPFVDQLPLGPGDPTA